MLLQDKSKKKKKKQACGTYVPQDPCDTMREWSSLFTAVFISKTTKVTVESTTFPVANILDA